MRRIKDVTIPAKWLAQHLARPERYNDGNLNGGGRGFLVSLEPKELMRVLEVKWVSCAAVEK